ncbi:alpha/beta fold hydrolase [Salinibacillus xinjiangensis]|uniref:alpha/beta fold hydrolase n=1 Tax=Salinibacillus xinjiangensis TaxID=1229268 RepID=UPI00129A0F5A|nr:alpha/beta fold hydrolase [Salinibacillus xinjiangensis]
MSSKIRANALVEKKEGLIESKSYKTYYEIHTPFNNINDSTPIILLAGGPGLSYTTLTPLFNLAKGRQVIAYDQLGSGKSTRSGNFSSLNIKDFMEQFNIVVTELDINKFHLLGHSWGTILGVNIALEYPEKTQSLILHSGIANWKKCLKERRKFEKEHFPDELKQIIKTVSEGFKPSAKEMKRFSSEFNRLFNRLFYCRAEYPEYLLKSIEDKDVGTNQLIWNPENNKEMATYDICDRLNEIKCPTLILSGKYDGISVGQASLFEAGIMNSKHVELQNSSHYSHIEEELRFLEHVNTFLKDVENK